MKTILVTGSAGFVGSHFVEHILAKTDWKIVGLDSFRHRGDATRVQRNMDPERYRVIYHDLNAPISIRTFGEIGKIDFIANFASESHVDRSIDDPVPFVQNNTNLILNMLEYARVAKPKAFIQISTDEVYGAALLGHDHREWETHLPSNPYAASKAAQEAIAISYWRTYGVPVVLTNTMNMIGERQDAEKFLPMLISRISRGQTVTIHGSPDRIGSRYYLHARNHADAILFLLQKSEPRMYEDRSDQIVMPNRFNVVGNKEINNLVLAQMVADLIGKPLHYEWVDFHAARPGHDRRYALDGEKIAKMGWKAPLSLEESLKRTIQWTLSRPQWLELETQKEKAPAQTVSGV